MKGSYNLNQVLTQIISEAIFLNFYLLLATDSISLLIKQCLYVRAVTAKQDNLALIPAFSIFLSLGMTR